MVRVSRYQAPRYLTDGQALGAMDVDRVLECYNLYARTRPMVLAHRGDTTLSVMTPWRSGERVELEMLEFDASSNDWGIATIIGDGTDTQSRFVVPMQGWWLVSAFAAVPYPSSSTRSGVWRLEICKVPRNDIVGDYEGAQIESAREDSMVLGTDDRECNLGTGTIMWCDEADEVFARIYQTTGGDVDVVGLSGQSPPDCQLCMVWLNRGDGPVDATFTAASTLSAGNVPDTGDWHDVVDQALYVAANRPTVKVGNTGTGFSVPTATFTGVGMNSEATSPFADLWGWHSTVTNNTRVTVPTGRGGLYLVGAEVAIVHNVDTTCTRALGVRVNGTSFESYESIRQLAPGLSSGPVMSTGPTLVKLAAGDYIEAVAYQNSGISVTVGQTGLAGTAANLLPVNAQLYAHQVQEGTLATTTSFTGNGYQAMNTVLTHTWWNTYLVNNGISLVRDVRAASVKTTTTTSVATHTWTSVPFDAENFDNGGYWSSLNPTLMSVPSGGVEGWYLCGGALQFAPTGATRRTCSIRILKNLTDTVAKRGVTMESATFCTLTIPATLVYLEVGDRIDLQARHNVGSNISVGGSSNPGDGNLWLLHVCSRANFEAA